jgi:hypothetical protein
MIRRVAPLAVMPAGALAVHQLRFWLAFGDHTGAALQAQGHSYLHSVAPWLVLLIAVAAGAFLHALGRAFGGQRSLARYTLSFAGLWLLAAACLVAIYVAQECLEGLFASGHPAGLAGIFGYGGWWSIPAALAVGLVLAALFHGARWALNEVARRHGRPAIGCSLLAPPGRLHADVLLPLLAPLAGGWSDRGPPR